jgi:hypothetical protein
MSAHHYYAKLQKGMIHAGVHEETEDKICHFYSRLHTKIQDIVDYNEYNIINQLFQLAMLTEKELQGCQTMKLKTTFTPHSAPTVPSRTATPFGARSSMTPSAFYAPSMSLTPSIAAPHATDPSKTSALQEAVVAKPSSSIVPTGRTSDIKFHRCHGIDHFQRDCPIKKSYIATAEGGYVSASGIEDDLALQTNHAGDLADDDDDDEQVFRSEHTADYSTKTYVVQRVLSANVDHSEKLQRHNLFHIFFVVKDCRVHTIIDC